MRSPDGLVGGHDTPENMAVLNEILAEKGALSAAEKNITGINPFQSNLEKSTMSLSQQEKDTLNPLDIKYFEKVGPRYIARKDHPIKNYAGSARYSDLAQMEKVLKKVFPNTKVEPAIEKFELKNKYSKPEWSLEYLENVKSFNRPSAIGILSALDQLSKEDKEEFLDLKFDRLDANEAVTFLNRKGPSYTKFLKALDASRKAKAKDGDPDEGEASGSKAGRGEFIMTLLIKGAESAGIASGDIILNDGRSIEVKETDDVGESFRATRASFGGQFNNIPYVAAVSELIAFCSGNKERADALIELTEKAGIVDGTGSGTGKKRKELSYLKIFFTNPSIESINTSIVYGLEKLGAHIRNINKEEAENQIMAPDKVEFDVKNQTNVLKVTDVDPNLIDKVQNPPAKPETVTIKVSSIEKEKKRAELIIPQIKKLKFFKYEKTSMKEVFTPENIAKSMFEAMSKPPGHYTGGIIFYNSNNGKFTYEEDLTNFKHGQYYFQSYQQTGPKFTKKEPDKIKS